MVGMGACEVSSVQDLDESLPHLYFTLTRIVTLAADPQYH